MRYQRPRAPSKRAIANQRTVMASLYGTDSFDPLTLQPDRQTKRTGPQEEGQTNKAIREWAPLHPELMIARNKRRLATPPGMQYPIMLGYDVKGSSDWLGYRTLTVTANMVGQRIAQFVAIEAKRPSGGVVSDEQEKFINAVNDAGGIAGVARNADDCERILQAWKSRP